MSEVISAKYDNNEAIQGVFREADVATYAPDASSSVDPFLGKANKYAESKIVRITTETKAVHYVWGASDVADCTTDDDIIPAGTSRTFLVDSAKPYLRLLENAATAVVRVTEIN